MGQTGRLLLDLGRCRVDGLGVSLLDGLGTRSTGTTALCEVCGFTVLVLWIQGARGGQFWKQVQIPRFFLPLQLAVLAALSPNECDN